MTPSASLEVSQLDQVCSGSLDVLLEQASFSLAKKPSNTNSPADSSPEVEGRSRSFTTPPLDPARAAKLRAANEIVRNSWQFKATGSARAAAVLAEFKARRIPAGGPRGMAAQAAALIAQHSLDDTLYVYDLGNTMRLFKAWRAAMPRVVPYYAVKCNPEPALLKLLAALGAGFDCASKAELETVLGLGVGKDRLIFAHPCKRPCDLRFASENGIQLTTFDTESELHKVVAAYPGVSLVLRIRCDDPGARVPLGLKYGANPEEAPKLLAAAMELGLSVVGVSFHVGSACKDLATFEGAIATAKSIFDTAEGMGHTMRLLDIGGGFTGHFDEHGHVMFGDIARTINKAISMHFPVESGVKIIAEPGRYFAETSACLVVPVYGKRDRQGASGAVHKDYWLTDGLYGSFNCIIYDGQKPQAQVLRSPLLPPLEEEGAPEFESTLWGPTCDSADYIYKDVPLPELRNGDWLLFPNSGAYTVAGACDFNGIAMTSPNKFFVCSQTAVDDLETSSDSEEGEVSEEESSEDEQ